MKITYIILYCLSGLMFLTALSGSSFTKPYYSKISEKTLEMSGFRKSFIQETDSKIDELIYKSKQIELQIEKIKNFFSSEKIDESKFGREKSEMLEKSVYNPMIDVLNFFFRIASVFAAFILFLFAVIFQLIYRSVLLRKRISRLEEAVYANTRVQVS